MSETGADLAVVMITKDEEGAVAKVIGDIRGVAPEAEVLVVDSSKDATADIAEQLGARVIRQFPPKGYGPAMLLALLTPDRDIVVTLDCDDTYPVEHIPRLAAEVRAGADIAGTTRLARGRPAHMPLPNYVVNRAFNLIASIAFGRRIGDVHSGMRAYRRDLLHEIPWRADGPALPVELLLWPVRRRKTVVERAIDYRPRIGETTLERFSSAVWTVRRILMARFAAR